MRAKLAWVLMAAALLAVAMPASTQERNAPVISDIRQEAGPRSTRLVVESSGPLAYTYYSPDPLTLVIDLPEVNASKLPSRINVGTREVDSVRVTALARADGRSIARLEVRLASLVPYQIYSKDRALNMVFERTGAPPDALKPAAAAAEPASVPVPPPAEKPAEPLSVVAAAEPPSPDPSATISHPPVAAAVVAPPPSAPTSPVNQPPASRILAVTTSKEEGRLAVTIKADGALRYQDFVLANPDRLVVDFRDVAGGALPRPLEVNQAPVKKVRLGQFSASPRVARLVLDLSAKSPYRIDEGAGSVRILLGDGPPPPPPPAPLAALRTEPPAAEAAPPPSVLAAPVPAPPMVAPILPEPQLAETSKEVFESKMLATTEKKYTGDPVTLDFKEGDILDIFRLFSEISGLNIVVNPGVSGRVTLKLNQVPWDQALDLILKANNLGHTRDENVVRIAPLTVLQKEDEELRKLKENQALAGDLGIWRKSLSYAKSEDLEPTIKKVALSSRGNITLDKRTNTMIIQDLPANIEKAKDLIADLDRATRQVEIEARIVITTRQFTRDIGIQWGFLNQMTPQYGNTTGLSFPNAIIVNGQGTPGVGLAADQLGLSTAGGIGPLASPTRGYAVNLPASGFTSSLGISLGNILGNFNIDAALTALERQGRGRLLSTPKVTTQNNKEAEIKQGVQIPVQTNANNTISTQFKDAVLTLKVTPQITEAGTVILNIDLQNNTPDYANKVNGIPPINTQSAKTEVLVRDGATTVIGGIYQSAEDVGVNNTPFLSQIPLLGYLFKNKSSSSRNNEMLLFITPRIVKG